MVAACSKVLYNTFALQLSNFNKLVVLALLLRFFFKIAGEIGPVQLQIAPHFMLLELSADLPQNSSKSTGQGLNKLLVYWKVI